LLDRTTKYLKVIKLVFGLALLFFIVWKVWNEPVLEELRSITLTNDSLLLILFVIALMPLNWLLESSKFKFLMSNTQFLSWKGSLLSVLAGVSTGIMTPNRIGNFIGRTIYVSHELKRKAVFVTLHANLAQFLATVIFGTIGLAIFGWSRMDLPPYLIEILSGICLLLGLVLYARPSWALKIIPDKLISERTSEAVVNIDQSRFDVKLAALFLSLLRYLIFLLQFCLLLLAFHDPVLDVEMVAAIAVVFLITTLIPSPFMGKLFVREASALFVLSVFSIPSTIILLAAFLLWFINLAIPSLFGAWVLIRKS
jgi:hypothetical protein